MRVGVRLHGGGIPAARRQLDADLPERATVGDLLDHVAGWIGHPLTEASPSGLPETLRVFVDGEAARSRDDPLRGADYSRAVDVIVVLVSPMTGGA